MDRKQLTARARASTILEVLISMIIIVVVFGIGMMIYTNVSRSSVSAQRIRAQALLSALMLKAARHPGSMSQTLTIDDFRIEQQVSAYGGSSDLSAIHLTAYDQNQQKIAELQTVILASYE